MNRRSFFTSLGLIAAGAAVAPSLFLPRNEAVRWKRSPTKTIWVPNPEYESAPYEMGFLFRDGALGGLTLHAHSLCDATTLERFPMRFADAGMLLPIYPFVAVTR